MNLQVKETKLFSEDVLSKPDSFVMKALRQGSVSEDDFNSRLSVYEKVFSNYEETRDYYARTGLFSGYTETPLLSNQYFNATVASYASSFAGYVSIERSLDQPTALLYFNNLLNVNTNAVVLPNLGAENRAGIASRFTTTTTVVNSQTSYIIATGKKLIPRYVNIQVTLAVSSTADVINLTDDGLGNLLGLPGLLAAGSQINYSSGTITIVWATGLLVADYLNIITSATEDVAGTPATGSSAFPTSNRFKLDWQNIILQTDPEFLIAEMNIMSMAAANKATKFDQGAFITSKLTELYTKIINDKLVSAITGAYTGTTQAVDLSGTYNEFTSRLQLMNAGLVDVDTALVSKSTKGVKATAYLAGKKTVGWFEKTVGIGSWKENKGSTYINDLVGWWNGVPVLRHDSIGDLDGYAVHKTLGGELAPCMRGIFLPITNTPAVGNYNNPTQIAQGIYYQENATSITSDLVQKFTVTEP